MRIGIEAQRLFRKKKHGMDIVALEMIRALQKIDTSNEYFIFVKPDEDNKVISETENFKIIELAGGPYPYWEQVLLPKAAKQYKLDLLHCTSNTAPINCPVALVLTLHDIIYLEKMDFSQGTWYQRLGNLYRKLVVPRIVDKCSSIITVSEYEKNTIQKYFKNLPSGRLVAIHNAAGDHFSQKIDDAASDQIKKAYNLPERYVFFLGNTDPKKNVIGVMKAMKIIKDREQLDFKLVMPDYDRSHLEGVLNAINAIDLLEDIQLTGYIKNTDLPVLYKNATLFIYPSLRESFGIPILEAMGGETPVLTSRAASMPEVAGNAAFYCDPKNAEDIANNWINAMQNEDAREQMVELGNEVASSFSWAKTAEKVLELYKKR